MTEPSVKYSGQSTKTIVNKDLNSLLSSNDDDDGKSIYVKNLYPFFYNNTIPNFHTVTANMSSSISEEIFTVTDFYSSDVNRVFVFVKLSLVFGEEEGAVGQNLYLLRIFDQKINGNSSEQYEFSLSDQKVFTFPSNLKCTSMNVDSYTSTLILSFVDLTYMATQNKIGLFCQKVFLIQTNYGNISIIDSNGFLLEDSCVKIEKIDPTIGEKIVNSIEVDYESRLVYILTSANDFKMPQSKIIKLSLIDPTINNQPIDIRYDGFLDLISISNMYIVNIYTELANIRTAKIRFLYVGVHYLRGNEEFIVSEVKQIDLLEFNETKSINFLPHEQSEHSNIKVSKSDATELFVIVKYYRKEFCILQKIDMLEEKVYYQESGMRCRDFGAGDILLDTSPFDLFLIATTHPHNYMSSFSIFGGPFSEEKPPTYEDFSPNDPRLNFPYRDQLDLDSTVNFRWRFISLGSYTTYTHKDKYGFDRDYYPLIAVVTVNSEVPLQQYVFLTSSIEIDVSRPYSSSEGFYIFVYENWFTTGLVSFLLFSLVGLIVGIVSDRLVRCYRKWKKGKFEPLY
ncbi:predicted protein [Naegleria gruberi]|uniref:Predicted protein n=1 Tax=Naegleria gruberi TaxID=5762 RepID=D2VG41_NAEGR|nr:uncharacterized protein NAEGRDRAFT_67844 [Naegleria gruberi]EFC44284.1 predicted protein [Naegleria gruberi]|eukprot:XP_002677028.1 predicted protein [Naegleria gruberi strain NEG-M]